MSLLFMDGYDISDFALKWNATAGSLATDTNTRFSIGKSIRCHYDPSWLKKTFVAANKVIVGTAILISSTHNNVRSIMLLRGDNDTTTHLSIRFPNNDGSIRLHLGDGGTTLATSATGVLISNGTVWNYIEVSATIADSGGRCIVKVNNVVVIDFTGDTKNGGTNTTIDSVVLDGGSSATFSYLDDTYICNDLGTVNNDFLGDVRVQTSVPTGAGASTQFTPSVGSNWDNVNDAPYVPTTYNSSSTVGQRDTYAMSDLLANSGTILGVQEVILAQKSDAGAASIKAALKSGATVYYDAAQNLGTSVAAFSALREVDPATSSAWTPTNVNALEFGAEVA